MFLGQYQPNLDQKARIILPKKIRKAIDGREIIVARGFEQCIFGFEKKVWQDRTDKELLQPITDATSRNNRRYLFSGASLVELDQQGRFVIPRNLITFAHITKDVMVIGAGDHFEIWDSKTWENYQTRLEQL
ncbi:division/cell wall cluster transcriptional repressor MraZ [Candidatus Daviesbacteria bacterium]|nr:division/cell wall cluster transcriptional repressor MraZ [Candidatus Daviesbacteria bacterium]